VVEGKVKSVGRRLATILLDNGIIGHLHVSQISEEEITSMRKGDRVKAVVLSIGKRGRGISLSTKELEPSPGKPAASAASANDFVWKLDDRDSGASVVRLD
jgi:small subunit ribosomal protein S1